MIVFVGFRRVAVPGLLWLFYLGVLLFTALPQGLNTPNPEPIACYFHFGLLADSDGWIEALTPTDLADCARAGREIVTYGWLRSHFYEAAWPPGCYLLHAALRVLHAPVPLGLIFFCCCLWACVFLQFFSFARRRLHPLLAAGLPLAVLVTELMRLSFLHGWAMYTSEGPACALLLLGFGFLVFALEPLARPTAPARGDVRRTLRTGCCSGLCFAAAAYFRGHAELILTLLSLAFATASLVSVVVAVRRSGLRPTALLQPLRTAWWKSGLFALAVVLLSFHACTMPYRYLHNYRKLGTWGWISAYSHHWVWMWQDPATVPEGDDFGVGGGRAPAILAADWHVDAARLSPAQGRALALKLIRERPVAWLRYKVPVLWRCWLARNSTPAFRVSGRDSLENGGILLSLLVAVAGCIAGLFRARTAGTALWLLAFLGCVAVASIGPSMLFHFETRYLYPLKVVGLFLLPYGILLASGREAVAGDRTRPREAMTSAPCPSSAQRSEAA